MFQTILWQEDHISAQRFTSYVHKDSSYFSMISIKLEHSVLQFLVWCICKDAYITEQQNNCQSTNNRKKKEQEGDKIECDMELWRQ